MYADAARAACQPVGVATRIDHKMLSSEEESLVSNEQMSDYDAGCTVQFSCPTSSMSGQTAASQTATISEGAQ